MIDLACFCNYRQPLRAHEQSDSIMGAADGDID
jgi:hypothetical protein